MLNYNHLHYFHVAAVEGSVAAAAERLGVTQPTVSEQVRALERALVVSLFERTPGGLKLTEAGRLAFEHTSVMFRAGERLLESLGTGGSEVPRTLRVGIGSGVARASTTDFLMPLLALEACVPTIRCSDAAELLRDLRNNELDLVLVETEPVDSARPGVNSVVLLDRVTLVAVAPSSVTPMADWQNVGLVHYRATSAYRWDVEAYLEAHGLRPKIAAEADDSLFLVEAAAHGGYVAFVPRSVARDAVAAKRLRVLAEVATAHAGVHALYSDGAGAELAQRAVEVLIDHMRAMHAD
ncbi:MAG: LysR family transcriptional regulator [Deltaproteobacteria bacterium]|nr:LysR family transcriptional regulator [Deltaproteobacteria bacterium]MDQ3297379.1 LysR family transcriptional regulator [Myxococcota bacterium]